LSPIDSKSPIIDNIPKILLRAQVKKEVIDERNPENKKQLGRRVFMSKVMVLILVLMLVGAYGCATMISPATNITDIKSVDFSQHMKKGESCVSWVLLFGPFGDASIVEAAKDAGIKKVNVIDYKTAWYVFVTKKCVVVYGE
jgi:hypothetical protein